MQQNMQLVRFKQ